MHLPRSNQPNQPLGAEGAAAAEPSRLRQLAAAWRWASFPLLVFGVSRAALLAFTAIGLYMVPNLYVQMGDPALFRGYSALAGLCRWDCWHIARIAYEGYTEPVWTNFFPLFPLLGRIASLLTGLPIHVALILVANLAGLGALLAIFRVFAELAGDAAARWGLVLYAAYPFAFFQATGYPESLMICFSALALLLALRGHHIAAGLVLGLGVLTRHVAMLAGAGLLVAQVRQRGANPRRLLLSPSILGLALPWLMLGAYCLYQYLVFGNPLAFAAARDQPPWGPMAWWGVDDLLTAEASNPNVRVMVAYLPFAVAVSVGALALWRRPEWFELAAFALSFMLMVWAVGMWGLGRYTAACWPAFLPFGAWLARRPALQGPTVALLALFQGMFFFLFSHQYMIL